MIKLTIKDDQKLNLRVRRSDTTHTSDVGVETRLRIMMIEWRPCEWRLSDVTKLYAIFFL